MVHISICLNKINSLHLIQWLFFQKFHYMKTKTLLLTLFCISLISSCNNSPRSPSDSEQPNTLTSPVINIATSPIKGVDFSKAKSPYANGELPKEQLVKIDAGHLIVFSKTPVGLKHCFEELKSLLNDNNKSFDAPDVNNILLASYVDGIEDYESLDLSLQTNAVQYKK